MMPFQFPRLLSFLPILASLALIGCDSGSSSGPSADETKNVTETGQAAAKALMESLSGQLKGALQSGGPVQALRICQQAALPITASAGEKFEGVTIHRTTLKPRNPANAPDEVDRAVLEKMAEASPPQPTIEWQDGAARYYHPLIIQEVCLNCHGDPKSFSGEMVEVLAAAYPEDQATGYTLGDFRGLIRVDIERP